MDDGSSISDAVEELKNVLDTFPVGAANIENSHLPGKVNHLVQSVNLLRSKRRYLDLIANLADTVEELDEVERKSIRTICLDEVTRSITMNKAVDAARVGEYLTSVVERPDSDESKQKVLKELGDIQNLAFEYNEISSKLTDLKSMRMDLEASLREQLETTREVVNDIRESGNEPEILTSLEKKMETVNKMGRLINALLLGPGAELEDKWLDILFSARDCLTYDDLI